MWCAFTLLSYSVYILLSILYVLVIAATDARQQEKANKRIGNDESIKVGEEKRDCVFLASSVNDTSGFTL
jgi:hypothetical protein